MKLILGIGALLILAGGVYFVMMGSDKKTEEMATGETSTTTMATNETEMAKVEKVVVTDGAYTVVATESVVNWSGKKPLLEGYTNNGTLGVTEGTITVLGDTATGEFVIDMNTLDVGLTAKKPGQEGKLEEHLKGERWFNVEAYPNAGFKITSVTERADSATTFAYDITGDLTMKDQTHEVTFPATIYTNAEGQLVAEASTEIDRTKWGITAGSGSFFDDLADNVIDDMIALSFVLVAEKN